VIGVLALALAALPITPSWTCTVRFEIEGDSATLTQRIDRRGRPGPLAMRLQRPGWQGSRSLSWLVGTPPASSSRTGPRRPPARRVDPEDIVPRPPARIFEEGPSGAPVSFRWNRRRETSALWVHYYGDGVPVGSERIADAKDVRSYFHWIDSIGWTLTDRAMLARLAGARELTALLTNETGDVLGQDRYPLPPPSAARAAYDAAAAEMRRLTADYRTACERTPSGVVIGEY
jgi:hypothetical protein